MYKVLHKKMFGFTLAEVLITLGIIGVVAAMTIPGLVKNHQKKVLVEQLKVAVSTIEQGFKRALAEDGVDSLLDTELFKVCDYNQTKMSDWISPNSDEFANRCAAVAQKYFYRIKGESVDAKRALGDNAGVISDVNKCKQLVGKTSQRWFLNDKTKCCGSTDSPAWIFPNGMRMDWDMRGDDIEPDSWEVGSITALDVNGEKGPNTWGRDVFSFRILSNGHIVPIYGVEEMRANNEYSKKYWDYDEYPNPEALVAKSKELIEKYCATDKSKADSSSYGIACAARIIDNGWVMDY